MRYLKKRFSLFWVLIVVFCSQFASHVWSAAAYFPLNALGVAMPLGGFSPHENAIIAAYNQLRAAYAAGLGGAVPAPINDAIPIQQLRLAVMQTRSPYILPGAPFPGADPTTFSFPNQQTLLQILTALDNNFQNLIANNQPHNNFIRHVTRSLGELRTDINDRYKTTTIEEASLIHRGSLGKPLTFQPPLIIPNGPVANPNIFRDTLHQLIGRIFVVKNNYVVSKSSGMIIPRKIGGVVTYDQIITCCHSFQTKDDDPDLEFYFVRSPFLNPITGLPPLNDIQALAPLGVPLDQIAMPHFIAYLQHHSNPANATHCVRRITQFKPFGKNKIWLNQFNPKYHYREDNGFGFLNAPFVIGGVGLAKVVISHAFQPVNDYYAIGYPQVGAYRTNLLAAQLPPAPVGGVPVNGVLLTEMRYGPLAIMRSPVGAANMALNNNLMVHHAPTARGMSGGPILNFSGNTINILGVVQSVWMDLNQGCQIY